MSINELKDSIIYAVNTSSSRGFSPYELKRLKSLTEIYLQEIKNTSEVERKSILLPDNISKSLESIFTSKKDDSKKLNVVLR